jgi:hypothetical protein
MMRLLKRLSLTVFNQGSHEEVENKVKSAIRMNRLQMIDLLSAWHSFLSRYQGGVRLGKPIGEISGAGETALVEDVLNPNR